MELEPRVQLDHVHLLKVEVKTFQLQVENWRERQEADALFRALFAVALSLVGVIPLQRFLRSELSQGLLDVAKLLSALALDVQLDVVKGFVAPRLVIDVDALDVVLEFTLKEPLDGPIHRGALHLLLDTIAQDSVQLLRIVLCEGVHRVPTERLHELPAVYRLVCSLQLVEHILQCLDQRRRLPFAIIDRRRVPDAGGLAHGTFMCRVLLARSIWVVIAIDGVHYPSELANMEETLQ
mmetsp:Transcript_129327/g.322395  ORF Transcript_129327/g.322395 Transcript_129327/m.322395 type:complete len:237 (+) Transcript_129327:2754-3464(+)